MSNYPTLSHFLSAIVHYVLVSLVIYFFLIQEGKTVPQHSKRLLRWSFMWLPVLVVITGHWLLESIRHYAGEKKRE